jgi:hypothetical protein
MPSNPLATALVPTSCEAEAVSILRALRTRASEFRDDGRDAFFNAEQTKGVDPLHMAVLFDGEAPETYPSGQ